MSDPKALIEYNVQDIVKYIIEDKGIPVKDAMYQFYQSEVFEKMQNVETGLYLESSAYVYELYLNECKNGKLVQMEY